MSFKLDDLLTQAQRMTETSQGSQGYMQGMYAQPNPRASGQQSVLTPTFNRLVISS